MSDKTRDKERLKIAIGLLDKRQMADYTRQCREKKMIVLDQLNIALGLFDEGQTNKFTERLAAHEGFQSIPAACKGGNCYGCETGKRSHCPCFKPVDTMVVDQLGLTVRHKRKKQGD